MQRSKAFRGPDTSFLHHPHHLLCLQQHHQSPPPPPPLPIKLLTPRLLSSNHTGACVCVCVVPGHAQTQLIPLMLQKLPLGEKKEGGLLEVGITSDL